MRSLLLLLLCIGLPAYGEVISGTSCYATEGDLEKAQREHAPPPVRVELHIDTDVTAGKYVGAKVRYGAYKPWIPLVFAGELIESRGGELTTTWTEIIDGKPHGSYVVVTLQGSSSSMTYTNDRTGRRYDFIATGGEVGTAYDSTKLCDWAR